MKIAATLMLLLALGTMVGTAGCNRSGSSSSVAALEGPSEAVIRQALMGKLIINFGDGNFHVDTVKGVQRGKIFQTDGGVVVYPLRISLSGPFTQAGSGKYIEGQFDYYFYQDEFGSWKWEEKN